MTAVGSRHAPQWAERSQQVPTNTVAENGRILGTFQPAKIQHGNKGEQARWGDHL
jgi:hypothetical protein